MYEVYCGTERNPIELVGVYGDFGQAVQCADGLALAGLTVSVFKGAERAYQFIGEGWEA